mmetsp:Transcript_10023/g.23848  ORF Transcript_10023/g.23848 Transcript_10023/m.23848 type:complete len:229 (-) Transcript_10023:424-1110(-)
MRQNSFGDATKEETSSSHCASTPSSTWHAYSTSILLATSRSTSDTIASLFGSRSRCSRGSSDVATIEFSTFVIGCTISTFASESSPPSCTSSAPSERGSDEFWSRDARSCTMLRSMVRTSTSLNSIWPEGASTGILRGATRWFERWGCGPGKRPGSDTRSCRRVIVWSSRTDAAFSLTRDSSASVVMSSESRMLSLIAKEAVLRAKGGISSSSFCGLTLCTFLLVRHV